MDGAWLKVSAIIMGRRPDGGQVVKEMRLGWPEHSDGVRCGQEESLGPYYRNEQRGDDMHGIGMELSPWN